MIRVVIADDEAMICELITRLIDWDALGITILAKVGDGRRALELILQEKPEIVITDIRMPPFDGIELIRQVREAGLDTRFIVISGHRQFEYARNALKYDVNDYLLKPINRDELQSALSKITQTLQQEMQQQSNLTHMENRLSADTLKMRKQFLYDLVSGRLTPIVLSVEGCNETYRYALTSDPLGLFILKADCSSEDAFPLLPLVFERVLPIVRRALPPDCLCAETMQINTRLYCFFQLPTAACSAPTEIYRAIADELEDVLADYTAFSLTVCPARMVDALPALPHALQEAERAVRYRIVQTRMHISQYLEAAYRSVRLDTVFSAAQQNVFLCVLRTGERSKIEGELCRLFQPFASHLFDRVDPCLIYDLCRCITSLIQTHPDCAALNFDCVEWAIDNAISVPALIDACIEQTLYALQPYFNRIIAQNIRPVQLAIEYIEQHYTESVSLETVAEYVHLTPPYFSLLFKKETGSNFIDYLTLQRMNCAKQLLRHSEYSVSEIADKTGYSDAKYFSRVFAKSFGISPQKYRKL